jgi:hypothetical protein
MASPAWLTQEMPPSNSQPPPSGSPAGVSSGGPSNPIAAAPGPGPGPQARYPNAPGYVLPAPSFSYGVLPNATAPSGTSQSNSVSTNFVLCFVILLHLSLKLIVIVTCDAARVSIGGSTPGSRSVFGCWSLFFV